MADNPRPFDEVVAAEDPAERERFDRAKNYRDRAVEHDFHADVWLVSDRHEKGVWRVEYQDDIRDDIFGCRRHAAGAGLFRGVAIGAPKDNPGDTVALPSH